MIANEPRNYYVQSQGSRITVWALEGLDDCYSRVVPPGR